MEKHYMKCKKNMNNIEEIIINHLLHVFTYNHSTLYF